MSWNHRVLKRIHKKDGKEDDVTYWVCEVVTKKDGALVETGHTLGIEPMSENLEGLKSVLEQMLKVVDDTIAGNKEVVIYTSIDSDTVCPGG